MHVLRPAALSLLLVGLVAPVSAAAPPELPPSTTPELIERAVAAGRLDRVQADLYLLDALEGRDIPSRYEGGGPWDGTSVLLEVERRLEGMPPGADRRALRSATSADEEGVRQCAGSHVGTQSHTSAHFYIEYTTIEGGLTIQQYATSLDAAWNAEVGALGWAAPPQPPAPAPGGKYHVVVSETLAPNIYGLTADSGTHAGPVGNNPSTPWNDQDADASCIVLNDDYDGPLFPGSPHQALDATTSHELNHAIQFGYGALAGSNFPDAAFYEGGATWMEDEVFDGADDNYHYLWPNLADDMGSYQASPYPYWIVFRAITERYGTGAGGGGERIMQRFWELTSKNHADTLEALDRALQPEGETLAGAFVRAASAIRFSKPCGGGYAPPFCFEEGAAYVASEGTPLPHGSIGGLGTSYSGGVADNYAANFIDMPSGIGTVQVVLLNAANRGGLLTGNVVCDTGSGMRIEPFSGSAAGGERVYARFANTDGCAAVSIVVANVSQTEPNPSSSQARPYTLSITPTADPSKTKVRVRRKGDHQVRVRGRVRPRHPGAVVDVAVFERGKKKKWRRRGSEQVELARGGRFRARLAAPNGSRCRVEARFPGDQDHLPSKARRAFRC